MKLNIGSGQMDPNAVFAKDWVNVDFTYDGNKPEWQSATYMNFDLEGAWPINHDSVDCIFASHIFEHFEITKWWRVLQQAFRVLKMGAPIRIVCPDPRIFIRNWHLNNKQFLLDCYGMENYKKWDYDRNGSTGFTDMFFGDHYDHHCICSIDTLMINMIRIGFSKVYETGIGTMFPQYFRTQQGVTHPMELHSFDNRPIMSYYLEGVK